MGIEELNLDLRATTKPGVHGDPDRHCDGKDRNQPYEPPSTALRLHDDLRNA
jgi:hypothetical protein